MDPALLVKKRKKWKRNMRAKPAYKKIALSFGKKKVGEKPEALPFFTRSGFL